MHLKDLTFEQGNIVSPLAAGKRQALLAELDESWHVEKKGLDVLTREFRFDNFVDAMAFANRICELAEQFDHHPALVIEYGKAKVSWWTHTAHGIAANDFLLARETQALYNHRHSA